MPVDAAIATAVQLATAAPDAGQAAIRELTVALCPSSGTLPPAERAWIRQLRAGCKWCQDTLPLVWLPAPVADAAIQDQILAGVLWAGCQTRLRALLDLECAAMRAQIPLAEALARLTQPAAARPADERDRAR